MNHNCIRLLILLAGLIMSGAGELSVLAQQPAPENREHVVQSGESLYAIVATYYPQRLNRWTEVASDLVDINPQVFSNGLDTPLKPGMNIKLVDYSRPRDPVVNNNSADIPEQVVQSTPDRVVTDTIVRQTETVIGSDQRTSAIISLPVIGNVTDINGKVLAIDVNDKQRTLTALSSIYLGDAVLTDPDAHVSLRMMDEAVYFVRPGSRLTFETYAFSEQEKKGRSIITLIKGGFRAISGLLGKNDPSSVSFNTPIATVGIRGTDFGLRICEIDDCVLTEGKVVLGNGLYSGVLDGAIALTNNSGELVANKGEFFRTASPDAATVPAPEAAGLLFSKDELGLLEEPAVEEAPLGFWGWLKHKVFGS